MLTLHSGRSRLGRRQRGGAAAAWGGDDGTRVQGVMRVHPDRCRASSDMANARDMISQSQVFVERELPALIDVHVRHLICVLLCSGTWGQGRRRRPRGTASGSSAAPPRSPWTKGGVRRGSGVRPRDARTRLAPLAGPLAVLGCRRGPALGRMKPSRRRRAILPGTDDDPCSRGGKAEPAAIGQTCCQ